MLLKLVSRELEPFDTIEKDSLGSIQLFFIYLLHIIWKFFLHLMTNLLCMQEDWATNGASPAHHLLLFILCETQKFLKYTQDPSPF